MSMILCHIAASEASPGFLELTILHTGTMGCVIGDKKKSSCPLQDVTLDRTKFCVHQEWKSSAGVSSPRQLIYEIKWEQIIFSLPSWVIFLQHYDSLKHIFPIRQAGFSPHGKQFSESQVCDAIPQPQTLSLSLNVSNTSVVVFSSSMLTEALTPEKIIEEFRSSPNAVAGLCRNNFPIRFFARSLVNSKLF